MVERRWLCRSCECLFDPLYDEENYSFNSPEFNSLETEPYLFNDLKKANQWDE